MAAGRRCGAATLRGARRTNGEGRHGTGRCPAVIGSRSGWRVEEPMGTGGENHGESVQRAARVWSEVHGGTGLGDGLGTKGEGRRRIWQDLGSKMQAMDLNAVGLDC